MNQLIHIYFSLVRDFLSFIYTIVLNIKRRTLLHIIILSKFSIIVSIEDICMVYKKNVAILVLPHYELLS